ncbi:hypothetical protein OG225_43210 (plasmid) [Nocardia sp. NBC_01377]|uniref:hypothetical protein n=1 Tax=Nocardia sp. NBC_01377 TaxID=2903595 RepID=UPI002F91739D
MHTSTTDRTADQWAADFAARLAETDPGWTTEPSRVYESRAVAYLLGPGADERIRIEVRYDDYGRPTGALDIDTDFGELLTFTPPGSCRRTGTMTKTDDPEEMIAVLCEVIANTRQILPEARETRIRSDADDEQRIATLAEIATRLPMAPITSPTATSGYFGREDGDIVGRISADRHGAVSVDLRLSRAEALELADYLTQRRRHIGEDTEINDYDGPAPF